MTVFQSDHISPEFTLKLKDSPKILSIKIKLFSTLIFVFLFSEKKLGRLKFGLIKESIFLLLCTSYSNVFVCF